MRGQSFLFNLAFNAFLTMPERFPLHTIFMFEDGLREMALRRDGCVIWN